MSAESAAPTPLSARQLSRRRRRASWSRGWARFRANRTGMAGLAVLTLFVLVAILAPVLADPQRLLQILGNLIENGLRYTPAGGTVTLHIGTVPANARARGAAPDGTAGWVSFEVADTGAGIPASELPQIFERFYRADKARTREGGGSGLGLAIVQRLVEIQGGRIWVSSAVGHGTTFHIAMPPAVPATRA